MPKFVISPAAESDIEDILAWTEDRFGERARLRYEALLVQAMVDVADDHNRTGIRVRPEIAKSTQTYHLFYSRNRVPRSVGRVKRPRHFLLFRISKDGHVEVGRVLHDSMELLDHLPEEYR